MFKELFTESREQTKQQYLKRKYDFNTLKPMFKKNKPSNLLIQYKDNRSRTGISSGYVKEMNKLGVVIERNSFGETDIDVPYEEITWADNVKR